MNQKIIEVDLSTEQITMSGVPEKYKYVSGRALTSAMIADEVDPAAHPLGEGNILVFSPGLLAGTFFSSSNRLSAGAVSPLTGGIKESNAGGTAAFQLGKLGIRAVKIKGRYPQDGTCMGLKISHEDVQIVDLSELKMKGAYESAEILRERYGKKISCLIIGPAGELKLSTACIDITDIEGEPCRNLGRGGLGAVMGSKGLKALIIDDTGTAPVSKHNDRAKGLIKEFAKMLREHPVTGEMFPKFGTVMTLLNVNGLGGLPTRNFSSGIFEDAEKIGGPKLYDTISERGGMPAHNCMPGCVIRCSNRFSDKEGHHVVGSVDFETVCLLGSNIGISDFDQIADLNRICNDLGVDTMETGVSLGVLCEAGLFDFGDYKKMREALLGIAEGTALGRLIGSGAGVCGRVFGVLRVPVVKNQGMAAYDPRVIKGMGVTYAMSAMGADHTAGNAITLSAEHTDPAGKVPLVRDLHINTAMFDSLGICLFTARVLSQNMWLLEQMLDALWGWKVTAEELRKMAVKTLLLEREFNERAGFSNVHDMLPEFMRKEKLPPNDLVFDIPQTEVNSLYDF